MKSTLDIQHTGNLGDEGMVRMTFDENSIAHLMSVLTDLYSDPEAAVIREYSTNGLDAHRAAGNPAPIEVTLPSPLSPTFIVKDYGTGMSLETINDVLTKYGKSTKRETDEETGMLGLGFKSGLAYTSQFTVISTHEGKQSLVLVTRLEDGGAAIQVLEHEASDEPNGTEVHVPVGDVLSFVRACNVNFLYWEPGTILVNGEPPPSIFDPDYGGTVIDPDIAIFPASGGQVERDYIIMGNVRYVVGNKHRIGRDDPRGRYNGGGFHAVVRVPIGSVNFTPSREALNYTKRTLDTLATAREFVHDRHFRIMQAELDAAPTRKDAFFIHENLRRMTDKTLTYHGERIPTWVNLVNIEDPPEEVEDYEAPLPWVLMWNDSARRLKTEGIMLQEALSGTRLFVTGFTGRSMHEGLKYRIKKWCEDNLPPVTTRSQHVYIIPGPMTDPWCEDIPKVSIETIRAVEIPKADRPKRSRAGVYRYLSNGGDQVTTDSELPTGATQVFSISSSMDRGRHALCALAKGFGGVCAVINKGSENAFARRFPDVQDLWSFLPPTMDVLAASISPVSAYMIDKDSTVVHTMAEYHREGIFDPELLSIAAASHQALNDKSQERLRTLWQLCVNVCGSVYRFDANGRSEWVEPPKLARSNYRDRVRKIIHQYPLIEAAGHYYNVPGEQRPRHVTMTMKVEYVNGLWAARNQLNLLPVTL